MKNKPRVINITNQNSTAEEAINSVYIGRPSKFGNPFIIGRDGSRKVVIERFEKYILGNKDLLEAVKKELKGKNLFCFCAPKECHGDVLLKIANEQ